MSLTKPQYTYKDLIYIILLVVSSLSGYLIDKTEIEGRVTIVEKLAEKNPNWAGDKVGYVGLHNWIHRRIPKPKLCKNCKKVPPYDLANKGVYNRELKNWWWICRKCHMVLDGRLNNLKQFNN